MVYVVVGALIILSFIIMLLSPRKKGIFFNTKKEHTGNERYLPRSPKLPTLELYAKDLTRAASRGELDPVVGRDHEIGRVIQILMRRTKNNPILVGKAGVGKTAIVEGLAQTLLAKMWNDRLHYKRVLSLDLAGLLAGTKFRGEFEKRLQRMTHEIIGAKRSIILFIDEIHSLASAGEATGGIGAADMLKPALAKGDLQIIGATTPHDYTAVLKKDTTLARRFQIVSVREPTRQETIAILEALKPRYSAYHGVEIERGAITKAVDLSMRSVPERNLPDKAIDVMDEAASLVKLTQNFDPTTVKECPKVTEEHIENVLEEWRKTNSH